MSTPHSVIHSRNFVPPTGDGNGSNDKNKNTSSGKKAGAKVSFFWTKNKANFWYTLMVTHRINLKISYVVSATIIF